MFVIEPAHKRIARLKESIWLAEGELIALDVEDARFLLSRLENAERGIRAQQSAVDDASRRWRAIGYEDGYATGYDDALSDT